MHYSVFVHSESSANHTSSCYLNLSSLILIIRVHLFFDDTAGKFRLTCTDRCLGCSIWTTSTRCLCLQIADLYQRMRKLRTEMSLTRVLTTILEVIILSIIPLHPCVQAWCHPDKIGLEASGQKPDYQDQASSAIQVAHPQALGGHLKTHRFSHRAQWTSLLDKHLGALYLIFRG